MSGLVGGLCSIAPFDDGLYYTPLAVNNGLKFRSFGPGLQLLTNSFGWRLLPGELILLGIAYNVGEISNSDSFVCYFQNHVEKVH